MLQIKVRDSKNIKIMYFDEPVNVLYVFFLTDELYSYQLPDNAVIIELMKRKEIDRGKFFYDNIRMTFPYEKRY